MQKSCFWLIFLSAALLFSSDGQDPEASPVAPSEPKPLVAIRALQSQIDAIEKERSTKQQELIDSPTVTEKETIAEEIQALNSKIASLTLELESVATGIEIGLLNDELNNQIALEDELREFFRPIFQEAKRATAKPRELEQQRTAIRYHAERYEVAEEAIRNLQDLIARTSDENEKEAIARILKKWETKRDEFNNKLISAQYQLDQRMEDEDSLTDTLSKGVATFFRTRGKNILITLVAMALALFSLRFLHRSIDRFSPFRKHGHTFAARLFDVVFIAITGVLTVSIGLAALYALGDWMLLGFALIFLAGFLWASKTAILQLGDQVKLMLNLGSVREGERLVFNGIPWQVKRIGVYTYLTNPALDGGRLRLPLRDLIPLSSRPFMNKEPFFACEVGDWLQLADSTYGKVVRQTPEWVQIVLLGGTIKTYPIPDFLSQNPANLSRGFRLNRVFGVDYAHQSIVTDKIPSVLQEKLSADLRALVGGENVANVRAEFANAGASSLDIALIVDIRGAAADKFNMLDRAIQRSCVEACNTHGWVIPFTQITLHQAAAS